MKTFGHLILLGIANVIGSTEHPAVAQTNHSIAQRWLQHAEVAPAFAVPASQARPNPAANSPRVIFQPNRDWLRAKLLVTSD